MSQSVFWAGLGGAVVGAIIASGLPAFLSWCRRNTERRGELIAILEEIRQARRAMETALSPDANSSQKLSARLPLVMLERGYPKLIGEGLLTQIEISALVEYLAQAEAMNHALDLANQAAMVGDEVRITRTAVYQLSAFGTSATGLLKVPHSDLGEQPVFTVVEKTIQRLMNSENMSWKSTCALRWLNAVRSQLRQHR